MITFTKEFTVEDIATKTIKKRDGSPFTFTEATLAEGTKRKNYIVARVYDDMVSELKRGLKQNLEIEITSWKREDGKIWNNFVVKSVLGGNQPIETPAPNWGDDPIPF